jgi:thiol-disulfide isomerase/thioredoxin
MKHLLKITLLMLVPTLFLASRCSHTAENTDVIYIGYHSDACADCNTLKDKMKKMNSKYANEPIVFLKFDKTKASTVKDAEQEISKWGMLDVAKKDDGLKYVILYNAFTKEKIVLINYDDSEEIIASKIDGALKKAKR